MMDRGAMAGGLTSITGKEGASLPASSSSTPLPLP
jgi:hypothetical protein